MGLLFWSLTVHINYRVKCGALSVKSPPKYVVATPDSADINRNVRTYTTLSPINAGALSRRGSHTALRAHRNKGCSAKLRSVRVPLEN